MQETVSLAKGDDARSSKSWRAFSLLAHTTKLYIVTAHSTLEKATMRRRGILWGTIVAALIAVVVPVRAATAEIGGTVLVAQAGGTTTGELRPRYVPEPPEQECWYNSDYIFAFTRSLAGSTLHPVAKAPLFVLAIPVDTALLPFAAIGGLFG